MSRLVPNIDKKIREKTIKRCREQNIVIPTFQQLVNPDLIPQKIKERLPKVKMTDVNPLNLFRISWKNDIKTGLFGKVNCVEIPREITGVKARVFGLIGKYFPIGAHKVGAAFGCLAPRLVSGQFDPDKHKAVWPSTGNYCRGGAFDCALLACTGVAVLPEGMSPERFKWLKDIGAEVIATPGTESNVKEIYDACKKLQQDPINMIFNQFEDFGNPMFHYNVTGRAVDEAFRTQILTTNKKARLAAYISATGSAGTIAAGDFLRQEFPHIKVVATEAVQCPTLFMNGFGEHRIEGIGDKHIPWVHNVRNTDAVASIDDEDCMRILRLFNEKAGQEFLKQQGVSQEKIAELPLLGISSVCNLLGAIKTAKYFELDENDVIFAPFTDSVEMYQSRITEQEEQKGKYNELQAAQDYSACLSHQGIDYYKELNYYQRKAIHNLKYYTWIEQQGKDSRELNEQWQPEYWHKIFVDEIDYVDELITEFNKEVGL